MRNLAISLTEARLDEAIQVSDPEMADFRKEAGDLIASLKQEREGSQILITTGSLANVFREHNKRMQAAVDVLVAELRAAGVQLLDFIRTEQGSSTEINQALDQLHRSLESARSPEEMKTVRAEIEASLGTLRGQVAERRKHSDDVSNKLQERLGVLEQLVSANAVSAKAVGAQEAGAQPVERSVASAAEPATDPVTGLPMREALELALRQAIERKAGAYLGVFYVQRMGLINARLGHAIGDQVLLLASQHLATRLIRFGDDSLFRWSGPGFITLMERRDQSVVAGEVQRFLGIPLDQYFELPFRTIFLPIKMIGETIAVGNLNVAEITDKIEAFMLHAAATSL
jgi:GGDEF domain-containing protein